MADKVKTFSLCSNQRKLLTHMGDRQKAALFDALFAYNDGEEVRLEDPLVDTVFMVMVETIERMRLFAEQKKENGKNGGRPKTKNNQGEPNETKNNQNEPNAAKASQAEPNETPISESISELKSKSEINSPNGEIGRSPSAPPRKKPFVPPTLEEVQAYCDERCNSIDAQHFHDYYAVRGWRLKDGAKMQDWKACVRTWEQKDKQPRMMQHVLTEAELREQHNYEVGRQVSADIEAGRSGPWL